MNYKLVGYKGKHFIIVDECEDDQFQAGEISDEEITDKYLKNHIEKCHYYGIPIYIGKNKDLKRRIQKVSETVESFDLQETLAELNVTVVTLPEFAEN